jgi:TctA family transporter
VVPVIYIYSLYLAFIYGFVALAIFSIFYILVSKNKNRNTVWLVLMMSIPIAVSISYVVLCAVTKVSKPLEAGLFFLFPIAAIISGWTSLGLINKSIE